MAVKVERVNKQGKQEVKEEVKTGLTNEGIAIVKMLQRFDMIQTYTNAIGVKMDELYTDLCSANTGNPLVLMHIKTVNQLLADIDTQVKEATSTDLEPVQ